MTTDFKSQLDAITPPSPMDASSFTSAVTFQTTPSPAVVVSVTGTAAVTVSLPLTVSNVALPGSPVAITFSPGGVDPVQSYLTGSGASTGEAAEWNSVRLVPKDAYGNTLPQGVLSTNALALQFTPAADQLGSWTVRFC